MISRYEVLLWNVSAQRLETIEASDESEMKLRARLSVELSAPQGPRFEIRGVKRLFGWVNPTKEWLSTQEACEYTGWHRSTLVRFRDAGLLERSNDGAGEPRYRKGSLDSLIEGQKPGKRKAA